jgi:hypothetical protein
MQPLTPHTPARASAKYLVNPLPNTNYPLSADIMLTEPVGAIGIRLEGDKTYELNYQRP